jgi:DNA-directed RNA polymerase specialized sigma24 family protein
MVKNCDKLPGFIPGSFLSAARYIFGMSQRDIGRAEGVNERNVRHSITKGLAAMKKYYSKF